MMRALTHIFSRPQVLACTTLSEVLPLDLLVLHVQVKGWGWLEIKGGEGFKLRQFFGTDGTLLSTYASGLGQVGGIVAVTAVPEPASITLVAGGLAAVGCLLRRLRYRSPT